MEPWNVFVEGDNLDVVPRLVPASSAAPNPATVRPVTGSRYGFGGGPAPFVLSVAGAGTATTAVASPAGSAPATAPPSTSAASPTRSATPKATRPAVPAGARTLTIVNAMDQTIWVASNRNAKYPLAATGWRLAPGQRTTIGLPDKWGGRIWGRTGCAFDASAPIGPITPAAQAGDVANAPIWLQVNGADRQRSTVTQLIWNIAETIEHLSAAWDLQPGDLIYTGTPEGVGAVVRGDVLEGGVDGLGTLRLKVA